MPFEALPPIDSYRYSRHVQFADTDMAGVVHFPRFFYFMEECEHAFLRSLGGRVVMHSDEGLLSWPRVAVNCEYLAPAKLDDRLDIELKIASVGRSSLKYRFEFSIGDKLIAIGSITAVSCVLPKEGGFKAIRLPDWFRKRVTVHPECAAEPPAAAPED